MPFSWPPFTRSDWDDRANALLNSLSMMGHEDEGYASVPAALNLSQGALDKAAEGRVASSLDLTQLPKIKVVGSTADGIKQDDKKEGGSEDKDIKAEGKVGGVNDTNKAEGGNDNLVDDADLNTPIKRAKVLKTYEHRRRFICKQLDLMRNTVGGGRSGRKGRAECSAFFRHVLELLDTQYEAAMAAETDETIINEIKGKYVKGLSSKKGDDDSSSEEEEEDPRDIVATASELESEAESVEIPKEVPKKRPRGRPKGFSPKKERERKLREAAELAAKEAAERGEPPPGMNEQEFFDQHNDLCEVCNKPGELLCCATCNLVFHVGCTRPKLTEEPPDDWNCSYCVASGVLGGKKDGKKRRVASQACRDMEKMRRVLKVPERQKPNPRAASFTEEDTSDDEKPAAKKRGPRKYRTGPRPPLEVAAAAGCRKCQKELETGEKTRKMHDDDCPRKFQAPGRPAQSPSKGDDDTDEVEESEEEEEEVSSYRVYYFMYLSSFTKVFPCLSLTQEEEGEEEEEEEEEEDESEDESKGEVEPPADPNKRRRDGKHHISLEVAANSGCSKCKLELETGEKNRSSHDEECPRKFRTIGGDRSGNRSTPKTSKPKKSPKKPESAVKKKKEVVADAPAPKRRGRPPSNKPKEPAPPTKNKVKRPAKRGRGKTANVNVSIEVAAESGCIKCVEELKTGLKTRREHDLVCPRKWRASGKTPPGEAKASERSSARKNKRSRDQMEDTDDDVQPAIATSNTAEEDAIAGLDALGDLATMAMEQDDKTDEGDNTGDEAKALRGGGETAGDFRREDSNDDILAEEVTSLDAVVADIVTSTSLNKMDIDEEEQPKPLRGGGRTRKSSLSSLSSLKVDDDEVQPDNMDVDASSDIAVSTPDTPLNNSASLPKRELGTLTVPTPLKLGDESGLTYANNGRVQRSRKKPAVFDPEDGPAREWGANDDSGGSPRDQGAPELLRGGARPKGWSSVAALKAEAPLPTAPKRRGRPPKEAVAANLAAEAPLPASPKRRGRPPKNLGSESQKKDDKQPTPTKPRSNSAASLNSKPPNALFDCPVCLDLAKIKVCCFCACRICFNKFGKEQTMLCDKCDQEYHTVCLGLDKIPDGGFECPACIADGEKQLKAELRRKEREEKKRIEAEKLREAEDKKAIVKAQRKAAYTKKKDEETEARRIHLEKRKISYQKRKSRDADIKSQGGVPVRGRGPGRPTKAELQARDSSEDYEPLPKRRGRPPAGKLYYFIMLNYDCSLT